MPIRRRLGTGLTALTAIALLVAGCSDDPEPKFTDDTPTPTSTPTTGDPTESTSTDPTETETSVDPSVEPEYPEEANGKGKKAAEAFAVYFIALLDFTDTTQDTRTLTRLGPFCDACANLADYVNGLKAEGTSTVGIHRTVTDTSTDFVTRRGRLNAIMDVEYETNRYKIVSKDGKTTWKRPEEFDAYLIISRPAKGGPWRVDDVGASS